MPASCSSFINRIGMTPLWSLLLCVAYLALATGAPQPEVSLTLGKVKGTMKKSTSGREFYSFEGIPYAKPPIGKHRFKPPVPADPWIGVLNATNNPVVCIQLIDKMFMQTNDLPLKIFGSEDCLYLNIYTPKLPSDLPEGKLLDVIFYIHGGGFRLGAGSMFGPDYILDRDVVFVSVNYRLDVFGFLSFEDEIAPGNNGLKDQTLALRWINQHISAFGGNPNRITIAGMSAGSASVHYHVISPLSKGLFQKAIASSGVALNPWAMAKSPRATGMALSNVLGCPTADSKLALECLRNRPAELLLTAQEQLTGPFGTLKMLFLPVIEPPGPNSFIDRCPTEIIRTNSGSDVPLMFSHTDDEGYAFVIGMIIDETILKQVDEQWDQMLPPMIGYHYVEPSLASKIAQEIRKRFIGDKSLKDNPAGFTKAFSERLFEAGIHKAALMHAQYQSKPVYLSRIGFKRAAGYHKVAFINGNLPFKGGNTFHGEDHAYLFNSFFLEPINDFPEALAISKTLIDYWMKFITQDEVATWQPVEAGLQEVTLLDIVSSEPEKNIIRKVPSASVFWDQLDPRDDEQKSNTEQNQHNEL